MSNPSDYRIALRQTLDQIDEFWSFRKDAKHPDPADQPSPEELEASKDRRLADVTARANAEKKGYGFLKSLKRNVFGKKGTENAPVERTERSEQERLQAIMDRARREG